MLQHSTPYQIDITWSFMLREHHILSFAALDRESIVLHPSINLFCSQAAIFCLLVKESISFSVWTLVLVTWIADGEHATLNTQDFPPRPRTSTLDAPFGRSLGAVLCAFIRRGRPCKRNLIVRWWFLSSLNAISISNFLSDGLLSFYGVYRLPTFKTYYPIKSNCT